MFIERSIVIMVKCVFSFLLALICLVTGLPAEAARNDNYPTPLFCYVLSNGRVTTYVQNSTARVSGYIDGGVDQVQLNNIYPSDNWVYGGYPTSRGRKWAWFRVSDVIYDYNYQMKKTKALRTAPAYRKKERGQTIGSVYANDVIYVVSEYGDLAQIIYPISGGYKLGWVEKSVVDWGSRPAPQPGTNYPTGNIVNVSNGTYKIASAANLNMVLDLDNGRNENGANLHLWQWVGTPQQKFVIENCGNGYYSLRPSYTDKKLDGLGSKPNNGTNVGLWTSNGSNEQRWRFIDAGNGYVYIESKMKPGLSLDCQGGRVQNGVNVQVWMRGNVPWNKWKLERLDTQPGQSAERYVVSTNGATLALRSGPGTNYGIKARMPRGSVVEVYSISNGWANLSYNGMSGYAASSYLIKKGDNEQGNDWDRYVGRMPGNLNLNSSYYQARSSNNPFAKSYRDSNGRYHSTNCTWYAYGRFYEVNGQKLGVTGMPYRWSGQARNNGFSIGTSPRSKSVAVAEKHVMFVENVSNGYVYFTEANYGDDFVVKKMSIAEFTNKRKIQSYIYAK